MSTDEKSHSSTYVTAGISRCATVRCSTMRRRTPRSFSRRPSVVCVGDPAAAARTSASTILPPGPVAETRARSTPSSCATRRTSGVAWTRTGGAAPPSRRAASCCGASSARGPSGSIVAAARSPISTRIVPTGTTSPSPTWIFETRPEAGDGISTVVLSVWISTSGSSSAIVSPSETSQRATSPSVRPSPRSGSLNAYAIGGGPYRGRAIQASRGAISTRRPPSTRHSETACSSPARAGATSRGTYPA